MKQQKRFSPIQNYELTQIYLKYRSLCQDSRAATGYTVNEFCSIHPDFKTTPVFDRITEYIEPNFTGLSDEEFIIFFDLLGLEKFCQKFELRKKGAKIKYKKCKLGKDKINNCQIEKPKETPISIPSTAGEENDISSSLSPFEVVCKSQKKKTIFPSIVNYDGFLSPLL